MVHDKIEGLEKKAIFDAAKFLAHDILIVRVTIVAAKEPEPKSFPRCGHSGQLRELAIAVPFISFKNSDQGLPKFCNSFISWYWCYS